jgi:hypothetical protein
MTPLGDLEVGNLESCVAVRMLPLFRLAPLARKLGSRLTADIG